MITIDGTLGEIYNAALETEPAKVTGDFATFMSWADEYRRLGVRANADTPEQAAQSIELARKESASAELSICWETSACRSCAI